MENKNGLVKKVLKEWGLVVVSTVVISVVVLQFIQVARVHGASMEPTYHEGNFLIVDKMYYKNHEPNYNDVVVIDYVDGENNSTLIIKRIIGIGGDHIEIKDNQLYRNGELVVEDYIKDNAQMEDLSIDVLEDTIFVLGDNRNNSLDSRVLGYFDLKKDVIGKVVFKVF